LAGNTTEARLLKDITFPTSVLHEAMAMDEAELVLICHNALYGCVIGPVADSEATTFGQNQGDMQRLTVGRCNNSQNDQTQFLPSVGLVNAVNIELQ
jgi:hypothetical protein